MMVCSPIIGPGRANSPPEKLQELKLLELKLLEHYLARLVKEMLFLKLSFVLCTLKPRLHVGHFYSYWQTHHFLMLQGLRKQNVARGRFCNKITGTMVQNIHRIVLFATCCRYWGYLATFATAFDFCRGTGLRMSSYKRE